ANSASFIERHGSLLRRSAAALFAAGRVRRHAFYAIRLSFRKRFAASGFRSGPVDQRSLQVHLRPAAPDERQPLAGRAAVGASQHLCPVMTSPTITSPQLGTVSATARSR